MEGELLKSKLNRILAKKRKKQTIVGTQPDDVPHSANTTPKHVMTTQGTTDVAPAPAVTVSNPIICKNEYLEFYLSWANSDMGKRVIEDFLRPNLSVNERGELFDNMPLASIEKYAWAIPDERALNILEHFGPIVEIGAGRGFWARMMRDRGIDVLAYDCVTGTGGGVGVDKQEQKQQQQEQTQKKSKAKKKTKQHANNTNSAQSAQENWTEVLKGGPEVLKVLKKSAEGKKRNLFLCYPDDYELSDKSLALDCLNNYSGEYIILAGELFGETLLENPWGKSFDAEFQQELAAAYIKVLHFPLPCWPTSVDSISVWRRKSFIHVDDIRFTRVPKDECIWKQDIVARKYEKLRQNKRQ